MIQEEDGHRWLSRNLSIRMIAKKISSSVVVRRETKSGKILLTNLKIWAFSLYREPVKNIFHYLQNKLKKMVDENNTSGSGRKKWEFFEDMNDLMGDKPNVRPLNVTETSLSEIEEEQSATDDSLEDVEEQGTEPDKEPEKTKRKYATAADKLTNLFDDYWEKKQRADEAKSKGKEERDQKREERKDKRHKD